MKIRPSAFPLLTESEAWLYDFDLTRFLHVNPVSASLENAYSATPDLAEGRETGYICGNCLIRSRIESGPLRTRSFLFPERT